MALFALLLAARLCHTGILWAEEGLPMAAAAQMAHGKTLYRDAWFDKPPLLPAVYLLWNVRDGVPLRIAGALHALAACMLAFLFARRLWSEREGYWAAGLLAFFLVFGIPSAVTPLAADLLMLVPHLAAVYLAFIGRSFWSGIAVGVAFLVNPKALFVLLACAAWNPRGLAGLALGFASANAAAVLALWWQGALIPYYQQVWQWGRVYAGDTFMEHPWLNGFRRIGNWLGFHLAAVVAALVFWFREGSPKRLPWAVWALVSIAALSLGLRFFPRYFFQLLPVVALASARGFALMKGRHRAAALALLLVPLLRFGPRYPILAADLFAGREHHWQDVAMDRDSRSAAAAIRAISKPGDTLFVWGFRPEMFVYTDLPAAGIFLDSQPLNGVPADRHLTQSRSVAPELAAANRKALLRSTPRVIADGLGPYNPELAITAFPDLAPWLARYKEVARTKGYVIYVLQ